MNEMTTISVFKADQYSYSRMPPSNALEFSAWLAEMLESIPEEFRSSAEIIIDAERDYDDGIELIVEVKFSRPLTDEEQAAVNARRAEDQKRRVEQLRQDLERAELVRAELHAKTVT
jgi:hypothetical protein